MISFGRKFIRAALCLAAVAALTCGGIYCVENHSLTIQTAADGNWGLHFGEPGAAPSGNESAARLADYGAYYLDVRPSAEAAQSVSPAPVYLTFDAGFENGNTAPILDALAAHRAPAAFFLVGNYIEQNPELVNRMASEGHLVCNHTYSHPDMSALSDKAAFSAQLTKLEDTYRNATGAELARFYRPPQGRYSEDNLRMAQELGYTTVFWSLAYVDWFTEKQPTPQEAYDKLLGRIHPGAIVLLHSTSSTNAEILDDLLTKWEAMGYTFCSLNDLTNAPSGPPAEKSGLPVTDSVTDNPSVIE